MLYFWTEFILFDGGGIDPLDLGGGIRLFVEIWHVQSRLTIISLNRVATVTDLYRGTYRQILIQFTTQITWGARNRFKSQNNN